MLPSLDQFKAAHGRLLMMMPGDKVSTSDEGFWQSSLTLLEPCDSEALVLQFCITETDSTSIATRLDLVFYKSEKPDWREEISLESTAISMAAIGNICKARLLPIDVSLKASVLVPAAVSIRKASSQLF